MKLRLLTQNAKMKKTSKLTGKKTMDFALPAVSACPFAGECKKYCYASKGSFTWPVVRDKHIDNYIATGYDNFSELMFEEIIMSEAEAIRIHSSGDMYSEKYLYKWIDIIEALPHVTFYAYTKSLPYFKRIVFGKDVDYYDDKMMPSNFTVIYSYGGKHDHLINKDFDRYAIVIKKGESVPMDYAIMGDNDHVALANNKKIALLEH